MKQKKLFERTLEVLVNAFTADKLVPGSFCSCAVGNMVAAACGYRVEFIAFSCSNEEFYKLLTWMADEQTLVAAPEWHHVFYTTTSQKVYMDAYHGKAKKEIDKTGYDVYDLMAIEEAFELASRSGEDIDPMAGMSLLQRLNYTRERSYLGAMAVLQVLGQIHELDVATLNKAKARFVVPTAVPEPLKAYIHD